MRRYRSTKVHRSVDLRTCPDFLSVLGGINAKLQAPPISQNLSLELHKASADLNSVNPHAAVNRESSRDSAILDGVGTRKRAILDVDLTGRDAGFGAAVNKKPAKT
jgi:hypothetical protein